jgi:hypothetical protein
MSTTTLCAFTALSGFDINSFRLSARPIGILYVMLWVDADSILWDDVSCIMCRLISTVSRLGLLTCDFASYRFPSALLF